jgi:hypothetical protein
MSGRQREVPFRQIMAHTRVVLLVDSATLEREDVTATVPYEGGSFEFSFVRERVAVLEVLRGSFGAEVASFVSESVQRSKHWNLRNERDGVRKIMYYDQNCAFQEPLPDGEPALLLLKGHDEALAAHTAAMGRGLLPVRYREQVLAGTEDLGSIGPPPLPSPRLE